MERQIIGKGKGKCSHCNYEGEFNLEIWNEPEEAYYDPELCYPSFYTCPKCGFGNLDNVFEIE